MITIDRGPNGNAATRFDFDKLVSGLSGPHQNVKNIGDAARLVGDPSARVLFVLAGGWDMQFVAPAVNTEQALAQIAIPRLP